MKLEKIFLFVLFGLLIIITLSCTNQIELWEVSFVSNGGSSVESIPVLYNAKINEPTEPTKEGYVFTGWYKDDKLTKKWKFQTDKVKFDTTLYAKWEIQRWTVTFNSNGGSEIASQLIDYNKKAAEPVNQPVKRGYTFDGWYKESTLANAWDFTTDTVTTDITLYAKWDTISYRVTFDSNDGSDVNPIPADYNTTITAPSEPTKEGYEFIGWYKESSLTTEWDFDTDKVANNTTLYAKWIKLWEVTFNSIGGSDVSSQIIREGNEVTVPASPTKTGYTFRGWYKESTLENAWNFTTDTVSTNTTLYAKWTINEYTVTFDSNGGSTVNSKTVDYNTTITAPVSPTRYGYTFAGWYSNEELTTAWTFTTNTVTKDTTLYAKWNINEYTVTFDSNEGSTVNSKTADYNTKITASVSPTRYGYTFAGWYSNAELTTAWTFTTNTVTKDTTLYAKWDIISYRVTFDSNEGTAVEFKETNYNTTITAPVSPTRYGYTFAGWYSNEELTITWNFSTDKITTNTTLYAKWNINSYTVTFDSNDGSDVNPIPADYNTSITAPSDPEKEGFEFIGWYKESSLTTEWDFASNKVTNNTTLYAKWIKLWEVTFNSIGGSDVSSQIIREGNEVTVPASPTKTGHTFGGWYKESTLAYAWDFTTDTVTADITLYAKWNIIAYRVTFDSNDGSDVNPIPADYNTTITAPSEPEKEGFEFIGWYKESSLTTEWDFDTDKVTNNITLYAKWIKLWEVTFNSIGGSDVSSQIIREGNKATVPASPTKTGHTFGGWYKESTLANAWDFTTDTVTADITLYAKWDIISYRVTFDSNDGSDVNPIPADYNTTITAPSEPEKEGYEFIGWYKESSLTTEWDFDTDKVTNNTTLYAKWINFPYEYNISTNSTDNLVNSIKFNLLNKNDREIATAKLNSDSTILSLSNEIEDNYYFAYIDGEKVAKVILRNERAKIVEKDKETPMTKSQLENLIDNCASDADLNYIETFGVTYMSDMFYNAKSFNGDISTWDVSNVTDMSYMFYDAETFNGNISSWDVSSVTNMSDMFYKAYSFNGNISSWDVSSVTSMNNMFHYAKVFNGDISGWDVSNVTNMKYMFYSARAFNGDLSGWDVSNVTNMSDLFFGASAFNGDISGWDVSNVTNMNCMFHSARAFNGDISTWDVSNVTNMGYMFYEASSFNGDLSDWDVSNVTSMSNMFYNVYYFNCDLSKWDVSNVTSMSYMFNKASSFNGDISDWDVGNVTDMSSMFNGTSSFNGDISGWDVSNVTNMNSMFSFTRAFNGDISDWDVSNVTNISSMFFCAQNFNRDISSWDVGNVTNMRSMFAYAFSFNGDISSWDVSNVTNMHLMFSKARDFNGDISGWTVSNVTDMSEMFKEASSFNRDLSGWDVSNVTSWNNIFDSCPIVNDYKPEKFK